MKKDGRRRENPLDRRMQVRLRGDVLRAVEEAADRDGVGASRWVREAAEQRLRPEPRR